jgi:hypothetical protein
LPQHSPTINSLARKAQVQTAQKVIEDSQQSTFTVLEDEEEIDESEEPEKTGVGKRAWWWEHYTVTTLATNFEKGRGKKKVSTADEKYICKLCKNGKLFTRQASKLHGAASALKDHVENKHHKYGKSDDNASQAAKPLGLQKYLKPALETPPFEQALVNWIVDTC